MAKTIYKLISQLLIHLILQAELFVKMQWAVPPDAATNDYRVLPSGRTATITRGGAFAVFVLAMARCQCLLTGAYIRQEVFIPLQDMNVKCYSDSDHDRWDPKGRTFRDRCFEEHFPEIKRGETKSQVRTIENFLIFIFSIYIALIKSHFHQIIFPRVPSLLATYSPLKSFAKSGFEISWWELLNVRSVFLASEIVQIHFWYFLTEDP